MYIRASALQISVLEMNPAVPPRHARLIGCVRKCCPGERHGFARSGVGLDAPRMWRKYYARSESAAACEQSQDFSACRAKSTVLRHILREWRRNERCGLIGNPVFAIDDLAALIRPGPGQDFLPLYRNRIALIGRTESYARLQSHAAMLASSRALFNAEIIFSVSVRCAFRCRM